MRARALLTLPLVLAACSDPAGAASAASQTTAPTGAAASSEASSGTGAETTAETATATGTPTGGATEGVSEAGEPAGYVVGGVVEGLVGEGLVLALNDGEELAIAADGPFAFPQPLADGAFYSVTVAASPADPDQICDVTLGLGEIAGADVDGVRVRCVMPVRHVVVIGIDGLGGAHVPTIDTPALDGLMAVGAHSLKMQNALPTMSAPNWMSMIAGAGADQHGVASNGWSPGDSQPTPTIFAVLRAQRPDARIGVFHDWAGFGDLVEPGVADVLVSPGDEVQTTVAALTWMKQTLPDLLFIHLDLVDHAGHFHGWGSPAYVAAVQTADALVGEVVQAIEAAGMAPYTVVIVSADHGGEGLSHGDDTALERAIPLIVAGPQVLRGPISRELRIWDIAATVAALFKLAAPASWLGSPVVEALGVLPAPGPDAPPDLLAVSEYAWVYDDAGSGAFADVSIWRPVAPRGYVALGDVATPGHAPPVFPTLVVRDDLNTVHPPRGYEQIWNDKGSFGDHDVALWSPIPPLGYACLGTVAKPDHSGPPANEQIRCVRQKYLVPGKAVLTWTDAGSLALQDAGLWTCVPGEGGGQAARSFITRRHHSDPGHPRCWSLASE